MDEMGSSTADAPENQESNPAGQAVGIQEKAAHISSEQTSDLGAVSTSEPALSTASDNGSTPSPKPELTGKPSPKIKSKRRRPIGKANKAQQLILIQYYIRLFCKHFGSFGRMKTLSVETQHRAEHRPYTNLGRFHSDFYLKYLELCKRRQTTPYMTETVRDEIARLAWAEWHWWGRCVNLPMQSQRRELVKWVVEQLLVEEFESKVFTMALEEFCQVGFEKVLEE